MNEKVIFEISDTYLEARKNKDECEQRLKDANAVLEDAEKKLIEAMTNDELDSFKRNGVQISLVNRNFISAEAERKDELWAEMKKQGYEHLFSINANTLNGEVRRLIEENDGKLPTWLEGLIKQYEKPSNRIKK